MATTNTTRVELTGRIRADDVNQRRYQIWLEDGSCLPVALSRRDESDVRAAVRSRDSVKVAISGSGDVDANGAVTRIVEVTSMQFEFEYDDSVPPFHKRIAEIMKDVPESEWEKLPKDGARNHDHYIYGTPKKYQ
jgi:hypothetical protein